MNFEAKLVIELKAMNEHLAAIASEMTTLQDLLIAQAKEGIALGQKPE